MEYEAESMTVEEIQGMACGLPDVLPVFTVSFAGIAKPGSTDLCGRCIEIACLDADVCRNGVGSLVAMVADGAGPGEIAVSRYVARSLVGRALEDGEVLNVTYNVVDCTGDNVEYGEYGVQASRNSPVPSSDPLPSSPLSGPLPSSPVPSSPLSDPLPSSPVPSSPLSDPSSTSAEEASRSQSWWWWWWLARRMYMEQTGKRQQVHRAHHAMGKRGRDASTQHQVIPYEGQLDNRMQQMACGLSEAMYLDRRSFAAVNAFSFEATHGYQPCGTCATVSSPTGKTQEVMFVDDCGTCGPNDMLISKEGLNALAPVLEGTTYTLHPCRLRDEGIFLSVLDTGTYYARFALGNLPEAVSSAMINGQYAEKNHIGQFEAYADLRRRAPGPYILELTTVSGQELIAEVPFLESQWLKFTRSPMEDGGVGFPQG